MDERRHHKNRIQIGTELNVQLGDDSIPVRVLNVSFGGVLVGTDARPPLGTEVKVTGYNMGPVSGNVVRHEDNGFAVDLGDSVEAAQFAVQSITSGMTPTNDSLPPEDEAE